MTLIASFEAHHTPILVGDLLITRAQPLSEPRSTPLVHAPNLIIGNAGTRSVSELCQKVTLLHDHVCLAWAGSLFHASRFAEYIRSIVAGKPTIDYEELRFAMNAYPRNDLEDHVEFILYSWHGTGWGWFSNLKPFELGPITNMRASGTGTPHFIETINNVSAASVVGTLDQYNDLAMRALTYASLASAQQFFGGVGLVESWGGGFEVVVFRGGRLTKLGPICWLYWMCMEIEKNRYSLILHPSFMYQFYRDETAFFWVDESSGGTNRVYAVDPPFQTTTSPSFDPPDTFQTDIVVSLVRRQLSNGQIWDGCFVDQTAPDREPDLKIAKSGQETSIGIKANYFKKMLETLPHGSAFDINFWGTKLFWRTEPDEVDDQL